MRLMLLFICLTLCVATVSSRAELQLQPQMNAACRTAPATGFTVLRWKPGNACKNDCFVSRLVCANGKTAEFASAIHPGTTHSQAFFHAWLPWSLVLLLLPFILTAVLAAFGTRMVVPLTVVNIVIIGYLAAAGLALHASITGNPRAEGAWLDQFLFLNPIGPSIATLILVLVNARPVWAGMEALFYRYSDHDLVTPSTLPTYPWQAQLYEFVDPRETADHYRRETERLRAYKQKLDAETAFAEAYVRRERSRHHLNETH